MSEVRDFKGDLWPSEREKTIFERGYRKALEDAADVCETGEVLPSHWTMHQKLGGASALVQAARKIRELGAAHNEGKG